ncbi:MAG: hypothetical protein Q9201_000931 [Fulgogasparrea decipioides]
MLPSAKDYLTQGGLSPHAAAYTVIGCFLGGVVGIQLVSRLMHHLIPSHVVDCDHSHSHEDNSSDKHGAGAHGHEEEHVRQPNGHTNEQSPLLSRDDKYFKPRTGQRSQSAVGGIAQKHKAPVRGAPLVRRPSLQTRMSKLVSGAKTACDGDGKCYGYSDPCGQECFKAISRNPTKANIQASPSTTSQPNLFRAVTAPYSRAIQGPLSGFAEEDYSASLESSATRTPNNSGMRTTSHHQDPPHGSYHPPDLEANRKHTTSPASFSIVPDDNQQQHHHHVHTNAFLSIGLQTSIAIALHKLPEGFITYATNHANPKLGFAVFMALFIHNITEGFAMALPLYLAINSRWKAMFWSSLLGGVSQPFGAGVAALWFKVAGTSDRAPGETVYGCMFGITAGIMTSVALQLFSESLALNHNRNLCLTFAFIGMGILGVSFALTAG